MAFRERILHNLCVLACLDALGANFDAGTISKRRPLEVGIFTAFADRVKFRCTDAV